MHHKQLQAAWWRHCHCQSVPACLPLPPPHPPVRADDGGAVEGGVAGVQRQHLPSASGSSGVQKRKERLATLEKNGSA